MPEKGASVKYQPGVKSMRSPFSICAEIVSLLRKMDTCANDPSKSSTTQLNKHEICAYSLFTNSSFDEKKNVIDNYRGKDCLKKFCQDLKKHARLIVDREKKEMIKLTEEKSFKHYIEDKCFLCEKQFFEDAKKIILK